MTFLAAAIAMLVCLVPAGIVMVRGSGADAVVGYEFLTAVVVLVFALLAQGYARPSLFEFPVVLALLMYGGGLIFIRTLERWR